MVSVCLLAFNGEQYIAQQVHSILSQLSGDDELIISDDGSTDATREIIASIPDKRIRLLQHQHERKNPYGGKHRTLRNVWAISANCAYALSHARGDIIFLSDQDDEWLAGKVDKMCELLKSVDMAVHNCAVVNSKGEVIIENYFRVVPPRLSLGGLLRKSSFMGCCMAFRRSILEHALPFPSFLVEHDAWLGVCALKYGKIGICQDILMKYRRHGDNISPCGEQSPNPLRIKLLRRWYILRSYFQCL